MSEFEHSTDCEYKIKELEAQLDLHSKAAWLIGNKCRELEAELEKAEEVISDLYASIECMLYQHVGKDENGQYKETFISSDEDAIDQIKRAKEYFESKKV